MYQGKHHWVFDLDGTLIDTFPFYLKILHSILADYGITLTMAETIHCLGQNARTFFTAKLGPNDAEIALKRIKEQNKVDAGIIKPFPGIQLVLNRLKTQGDQIAEWTSRDLDSAKEVITYTGLTAYVDYLVSGCCVAKHKPDIEGLEKIAQFFKCATCELIMVGDHDVDVTAAKNAGAYGIRASWHSFEPVTHCC